MRQWLGHIHCVRKAQHLCSDCVLVQPPASLNPSLPRTVSTLTVYTQNTTNRSSVSTTTLDVQRLPMKQDCSCVVCEARACSDDDDEKEEFGKGGIWKHSFDYYLFQSVACIPNRAHLACLYPTMCSFTWTRTKSHIFNCLHPSANKPHPSTYHCAPQDD